MGLVIWVVRLGHVGFLCAQILGPRMDWWSVLVDDSNGLSDIHVTRIIVARLVHVALGHRPRIIIGIRVMSSRTSLLECPSNILELIDDNLVLHGLIFLPQIRQLSFQLDDVILLFVQY